MAAILLAFALALVPVGALIRCRIWLRGRPDPAYASVRDLALGVLSVVRRYLVNVHNVTVQRPGVAPMHILAAGGFILSVPLILALHLTNASPVLSLPLLLALIAILVAGLLDWRRRWRRSTLSGGAYRFVPLVLISYALFHGFSIMPYLGLAPVFSWDSTEGLALLFAGGLANFALVGGLVVGPMRHALTGALHLAFHPRVDRFSRDTIVASAPPYDLDSERLGVSAPGDFRWTELLAFDACVQCGRCEEVCPAFAAGQQLNPKQLIFDLVIAGDRIPAQLTVFRLDF